MEVRSYLYNKVRVRRWHRVFLSFFSFVLLFMLSSCKVVTSNNGKLDGLWQVTTMVNLQTGEVIDGRDVGKGLNWAFQGDLLMMRGEKELVFRFEHAGETLKVHKPYLSGRYTETADDTPITDASQLNVYGIYKLEEYFKILQLTSDDMQLESANVRLTFRKY